MVSHFPTPCAGSSFSPCGSLSQLLCTPCDRPCRSSRGNRTLCSRIVPPERIGAPERASRTAPENLESRCTDRCRRQAAGRGPPSQPRHPTPPRTLSRSETHACQEWSMTDLNSSKNRTKSRRALPGRLALATDQNTTTIAGAAVGTPNHACRHRSGRKRSAAAARYFRALAATAMNN